MKNNIRKTFRNYLLIGLIPLMLLIVIVTFAIWGISSNKKEEVDYSTNEKVVVHDTVYVKVQCSKNHFDHSVVEVPKKKKEVKAEIVPVQTNQPDTSN